MNTISTFLFDFDGTMRACYGATGFHKWADPYAIKQVFDVDVSPDELIKYAGLAYPQLIRSITAHALRCEPESISEADILTYGNLFREIEVGLLRQKPDSNSLREGILAFIHEAGELGLNRGIVSNNNKYNIDPVLNQFRIRHCFGIIADEDAVAVHHRKPNPEHWLVAARHLEVDPSACVAIDDTKVGIDAAAAAGMVTVWCPETEFSPEECPSTYNIRMPTDGPFSMAFLRTELNALGYELHPPKSVQLRRLIATTLQTHFTNSLTPAFA